MSTAWPTPIARQYDFTAGSWPSDYDRVDDELNQLVEQFNQLLTAAQAQELRITEVADDLLEHVNDAAMHASGLAHMTGHWMRVDEGAPDHKIKWSGRSISTSGGTRLIDKTIIGDITVAGAGGLDTGAVAANQWLFAFLIYNPDDVLVTMLFSIDRLAPTMPTGYSERRYIGMFMTDNAANIRPFQHTIGANRWELWDCASLVTAVDTMAYTVDLSGFATGVFTTVDLTLARPASPEHSPTGLPIEMTHPTLGCFLAASNTAMIRVKPTYNTELSPESLATLLASHSGVAQVETIVKGLLLPIDAVQRVDLRVDHVAAISARLFLDGWYDNLDAAS